MTAQPPSTTNPLAGYTTLSPSTYLSPPPALPRSSTSPSLILIFAWLDASPRHLKIHLNHYQAAHPASRIAVVMTAKNDLFFKTAAQQAARLAPILELVLAQAGAPPLIHVFSNGGAMQLALLARLHKAKTGTPLASALTVLDSCPGIATFGRSVAALSVALPRGAVARLVARALIFLWLGSWFALAAVLRVVGLASEDSVMRARRELLETELVAPGRRVYVYSDADQMVGGDDVSAHADAAEHQGWTVRREKFTGTGHVGHVLKDAERYWGAVEGELIQGL